MDSASLNKKAQELKALHQPGHPVILANVYDIPSARTVAALPSCKVLASASYAVALANGTEDEAMTLETNLQAVRAIGQVAREFDKPFTVDLQDGYGTRLEEAIAGIIERGAVGCNIEDCDKDTGVLHSPDVAVDRVRRAMAAAKAAGVPDFVLNARADPLLHGGTIDDVIARGKQYLTAGATTVFVIGGGARGGIKSDEAKRLVDAFEGRLNLTRVLAPGKLTVKEIGELGAARISVGPQLMLKADVTVKNLAEELLSRS